MKPSVLTSLNFIEGLIDINRKDDDIITNGRFTGALAVMDENFLRSREFVDFINRLDPNLLERRDSTFSFSGQIRPEYIAVLSAVFGDDVLDDGSVREFVNDIDLTNFQDGSFANFIAGTDAIVLTDNDFTEALSSLDSAELTNGQFTDDLQTLSYTTLTSELLSQALTASDSKDFSRRGSSYVSILETLVASGGNVIIGQSVEARAAKQRIYDEREQTPLQFNTRKVGLREVIYTSSEVNQIVETIIDRVSGNGTDLTSAETSRRASRSLANENPDSPPGSSFTAIIGTDGSNRVDTRAGGLQLVELGAGSDGAIVTSGEFVENGAIVLEDFFARQAQNVIAKRDLVINAELVRLGTDDLARDVVDFTPSNGRDLFNDNEFVIIEDFQTREDVVAQAEAQGIELSPQLPVFDQLLLPGPADRYLFRDTGVDTQIIFNRRGFNLEIPLGEIISETIPVPTPGLGSVLGNPVVELPVGSVHIATIKGAELQFFTGDDQVVAFNQ